MATLHRASIIKSNAIDPMNFDPCETLSEIYATVIAQQEKFNLVFGRFLEHSGRAVFYNSDKPLYFISSAEWMTRNLDHRIEVTAPVNDPALKQELQSFLDLQLNPDAKFRIIDRAMKNQCTDPKNGIAVFDSQISAYEYFKTMTLPSTITNETIPD
ncbi:MAG: hypothetical protein IT223_10165 [Crocinitomicaceae bacterium]|nr:hypothetical protein [Crocinitomicaceae bacterium]